ncbi:hypothetical protein PR048_005792 [Dryococelus australis]|uniref:Uncharacterized protein n=1 Tax=Dryococelus australis TaxID=614101 RepID=A0ABQ9I9A3_9NEOP|nr:hypothetical protein PR048_005792 [Dryococelus australis]
MTPRILKPFPFRIQPGTLMQGELWKTVLGTLLIDLVYYEHPSHSVLRTREKLSQPYALCITFYVTATTFDTHVRDEHIPAGVSQKEGNPGNNLHPYRHFNHEMCHTSVKKLEMS